MIDLSCKCIRYILYTIKVFMIDRLKANHVKAVMINTKIILYEKLI